MLILSLKLKGNCKSKNKIVTTCEKPYFLTGPSEKSCHYFNKTYCICIIIRSDWIVEEGTERDYDFKNFVQIQAQKDKKSAQFKPS